MAKGAPAKSAAKPAETKAPAKAAASRTAGKPVPTKAASATPTQTKSGTVAKVATKPAPAKSAAKTAAPTTKAPGKTAPVKASGKAATAKGAPLEATAVDEAGAALVVVGAEEVVEVDVEVELATLEPDPEALATVDGEATTEGEEPEAEDEGFVLSDVDDTDEPIQQVQVAGATADPVKDYLKQIGKVPLLNAEQEVELAKRIEAGLFAEEKLAAGIKRRARPARSSSGSPRTAGAPRTTCSRPTCAWSSRWPSATPAAACCSST